MAAKSPIVQIIGLFDWQKPDWGFRIADCGEVAALTGPRIFLGIADRQSHLTVFLLQSLCEKSAGTG